MNKQRRKDLAVAVELIQQAYAILSEARDDEEDAFNSMPESLQESERGQGMESATESLDAAGDALIETTDAIEEAMV